MSDGRSLPAGLENGANVQFSHVLGFKIPTGKAISHISDDSLIYLAGKHGAKLEPETGKHSFVLKPQKTTEIATFCVSANRKYIALAEKMPEGLQVNIYTQTNGSKVRSLEFKYLSKLPVVAMDFSTDNKYLATVTALPDVFIYLWQVDKSRLVGMIDVPFELTRITISPWAYWSMCTTGPSSCRLWKLVDKQIKQIDPMPKRKDGTVAQAQRFTCHCWYDDEKLVAGTEEGDIVVIEQSEAKKTLTAVHGEGYAITTIAPVSRGFICAGEGGIVSLFERTFDEVMYFKILKRFNPANTSRVVEISVSPKEENAVLLYNNNSIASFSLENLELLKENDSTAFRQLAVGFHDDTVTAVDVCVQKSFVVTGSLDRTVRVWNFMRRRVEFTKTFDEEVLSLALHPTGLRMVIGFKSYLRMYNVLGQDLHFCTEFPVKPCYEVRFSFGGQFFATVVAHRILIFNSYDFQCIATLSGHAVMIRSICWSRNDQFLTSADLNGIVYTWQIDGQKKIDTDDERKNVSYNCAAYDDATGFTAAIGACRVAEGGAAEGEITVRCIVPGQESRIVRPGLVASKLPAHRKQHTSEIALSSLAKTLFVGLPNGSLYLYTFPLVEDAQPYQKYEIHNGEVLFVFLSSDERYLFTVGEDNTLFMFEVDAICEGRSVSRKPFNFSVFDDVCYVLQSDVDEKAREFAALQQELDDLLNAKRLDEAALQQKFDQERSNLEREFSVQIETIRRQLEQANGARDTAEKALVENARQLESMHLKAAEELEALYTRRTEEAHAKYSQLKTERDDLVVRYENKLYILQKDQEAERRHLEDKCKEIEMRLGTQLEAQKRRLQSDTQVHDGMLDQTIADYETLVDELSGKYKQMIAKKDEELNRAINSSSTGERDADRLRREKAALLQQQKERDAHIEELEIALEKRKKENESLRKEMVVRFESISTAEKKIQQLKKQTTELEKLRYVLTFKFNELKKEVAPKDAQISKMTTRVEEMDEELERVVVDREALNQSLSQKEEKLRVLQREIGSQRRGLEDKERATNQILRDLTELVSGGDTKRLIYQLKDLIVRYNAKQDREEITGEEDKTAEFERQREYMEAQLSAIKRQNHQKESNLRLDNQRNTAENAILVKEINELRHEKKLLVTKCQLVEQQLKEARIALQRATVATEQEDATSPDREQRSSPQPPQSRQGRVIRGPTRALRDIAHLDADKISRIISQVERNNAEMERQQDEIVRLREFVGHLLARAESDQSALSPGDQAQYAEIKRHLHSTMTPAAVPPSR